MGWNLRQKRLLIHYWCESENREKLQNKKNFFNCVTSLYQNCLLVITLTVYPALNDVWMSTTYNHHRNHKSKTEKCKLLYCDWSQAIFISFSSLLRTNSIGNCCAKVTQNFLFCFDCNSHFPHAFLCSFDYPTEFLWALISWELSVCFMFSSFLRRKIDKTGFLTLDNFRRISP